MKNISAYTGPAHDQPACRSTIVGVSPQGNWGGRTPITVPLIGTPSALSADTSRHAMVTNVRMRYGLIAAISETTDSNKG